MSENGLADDPRLLSVAATIASGAAVDWGAVPADPETTTVLDELRSLEGLCRAGQPIPDHWGSFTITGELGRGSYGTVYRAMDANLNLPIALKVIRPVDPTDHETCAIALDEARLLAQINHPNVVRIYRAEPLENEVGISMELVRGQTLHRMVRDQGPFNADEAMLIGIDLCRATAAVHAARLLHGDIKANNVMRAEGGRTVLMDFGAGHDLKAASSGLGRRTVGTPVYLAPEVLAGGTPTRASDIYSLGVLLFYLVTGTHPVQGDTRTAVLEQHAPGGSRRRLRQMRPNLPDAFVQVVERAMAERPEERYATAGDMDAALQRALRREEIAPPRPVAARLRPYTIAAALTIAVLGIAYLVLRPSGSGPAPQSLSVAAGAPAPITPAAAADTYQIEAAFYRHDNDTPVRLQPGARVAPGDLLSLEVQASVPTHVYVVNEDEKGASFLLFPLPGQQLTNPLPPGTRHEIPGVVDGERIRWEVSTAGGREHFLVFASPNPPPPVFERLFTGLDRPSAGGAIAQRMTGELVTALRGVGGLAKAPAQPSRARLSDEYAVPLPAGEETARGVWVRQLTVENPGK